jgi:hypothetical protein
LGQFDGPLDNISGGGSFQVADFAHLGYSGPLIFNHLYVEDNVRIGRFVGAASFNSSVIFNGGILSLSDSNHGRIPAAFLELGINQEVVFRGTMIVGNRRISNLAAVHPCSVNERLHRTTRLVSFVALCQDVPGQALLHARPIEKGARGVGRKSV